jgi:hypothetical protein
MIMKIIAIICNVVLFVFTGIVLVTDGTPTDTAYIIFTLLVLLIPIFNVVVLTRSGVDNGWLDLQKKTLEEQRKIDDLSSTTIVMKIGAFICNIVLFAFTWWAIVDQYPHSEEDGVIAYTLLIVLTPILSVAVLFRNGADDGWLGFLMKKKTMER